MTSLISSVTASALKSAREALAKEFDWPSTETGFAYYICIRNGSQLPTFMEAPYRSTTLAMLRRTPELAAFGYTIGNASAETKATWLAAIEHLRGREIYPADRQSFIFNPIEILGIAVGLATIPSSDNHTSWLISTIHRGLIEGQFRTPLTIMAAHVAMRHLGGSFKEISPMIINFSELTASELILAAGIYLAFPVDDVSTATVEEAVIRMLLDQGLPINDAADSVIVAILMQRANDRLLLQSGSTSPLDIVLGLCRRFPLYAKSLEHRQRSREPLIIIDEYDVQDALLAILKLHFDDVRPEECTPSYASKSSRLDFFLPQQQMIIEAKMTRENLGHKEVVDELLIDIGRYSNVPSVKTLVCLIYDPLGKCRNPRAIESDIENGGSRLNVRVVVCPLGL